MRQGEQAARCSQQREICAATACRTNERTGRSEASTAHAELVRSAPPSESGAENTRPANLPMDEASYCRQRHSEAPLATQFAECSHRKPGPTLTTIPSPVEAPDGVSRSGDSSTAELSCQGAQRRRDAPLTAAPRLPLRAEPPHHPLRLRLLRVNEAKYPSAAERSASGARRETWRPNRHQL